MDPQISLENIVLDEILKQQQQTILLLRKIEKRLDKLEQSLASKV